MSAEDRFETAKTTKEKEKLLSTGCQKFDAHLQGGIPCQGITQIYGAASTGKTQLALQLCLMVQLPLSEGGLGGGAVYVCTQAVFPSRRLQQLLETSEFARKHKIGSDAIYVEHVGTIEEFETCLLRRIPILMCARNIKLIIVDSIAALYRTEEWDDAAKTRAKSLRTVGQQLHALCKNNDVCVVCINQVSAVISTTALHNDSNEVPALGTTWSSMVTTSFRFYRIGILRYVCIMLSSKLAKKTIPIEIYESGVRALD